MKLRKKNYRANFSNCKSWFLLFSRETSIYLAWNCRCTADTVKLLFCNFVELKIPHKKKSIWYFAFHLKSSVVLSSESDSLGTDICHWYGVTIHLVWHCGGPGYNHPCWLCGLWSYSTAICTLIGEKLILPIPLNILHWNTSLFVFHIKPRDSQTLLKIVINKKLLLK